MSNVELQAFADKLGVTFINLEPHPERPKELRLHERGYLYPGESKVNSPMTCFLLFSGAHFDLLLQGDESEDSMEWTNSAGQKSFFSVLQYGLVMILQLILVLGYKGPS